MTQKYIVSVPGRAQPLCIEADNWSGVFDNGAVFFVGEKKVASFASTDLIALAENLPDFPALSQFAPSVSSCVDLLPGMTIERVAEPVRGLDPVGHTTNSTHYHGGTPVFWPALACGLLGFVGGIGLAIARAWGL
ncbi:hypothetical protein D3C81_930910 [compost metagenome]